ncbi:MAG TPA: choice-of-anchor Q domain-containing protein [Vicinamibacterales bacterium]|nr:choice-of-anchor Q domain-containing protein [Vicinamibacterales bacterium]
MITRSRALPSFVVAIVLVAAASNAAPAWTPPIGIPAPTFGIAESAPAVPSPWTAPTDGFFYVDASRPDATDTANLYGTPTKPRATIPTVLPAGAVVELHGTYDADHSSPRGILALGTRANPVFIRGASGDARPLIRNGWEVRGSYFVLENLEFGPRDKSQTGSLVIVAPTQYAAVRHSDLHGNLDGGGLGVVSWDDKLLTQNVVVYDVNVHDNGDVHATFDQDNHGIAVSFNVDHLWVVDSQLARNSGDGIQINAGNAAHQATTHHVYVGRNVAFGNKQTGFWAKQAVDVIFSQNECHSHRPSNSSFGQCMGYQYATDWIWFLYNHIYDSDFGIAAASDNGLGNGTEAFFVGNVIHNIHTSDPQGYNPQTSWSNAAIMLAGGVNRHVVNNTIYDVDAGINVPGTYGTLDVADNIIANVTDPESSHLFVEMTSLAGNTKLSRCVLEGDPRIKVDATVYHFTAAQLATVASSDADPQFVDPAGGDLHLRPGSPAIDAGDVNAVYATFQDRYGIAILVDKDGVPRPQGSAADIGAYEAAARPSGR